MPNILFLGGAPKCGTSSFFDLLSSTRAFVPSTPKETFYYIDREYPLYNSQHNFFKFGHIGFDKFFQGQKKPRLEATTHLLYQKQMPAHLASIDSKILFILRNPADRIRSSFEYTLNNLGNFKEIISFSDYVNLLLENKIEKLESKMRTTTSQWVIANELMLSDYVKHLDKWQEHFGSERLLVLNFEDIKLKPRENLFKVLQFAGIEYDPSDMLIKLEKKNQTVSIKNKTLHNKITSINKFMPSGRIKSWLKTIYFKFQKTNKTWTNSDEIALRKLREFFCENQPDLATILNTYNK